MNILQKKYSLFSTDAQIFWPAFVSCIIVVIITVACGAIFECRGCVTSAGKEQEQIEL